MCFIAANGTGKAAGGRPARAGPGAPGRAIRCSFVEDLNWPVPTTPQKKRPRPIEVWVPGPAGNWDGEVPRLQ
jgi:hypothetical protein